MNLFSAILLYSHDHEQLCVHTRQLVTSWLCQREQNPSSCTCSSCYRINHNSHHGIRWLSPGNQYLLHEIDEVINATSLALAPDEHIFFVFDHAEKLSPATGNRLLKLIEEPPTNYHFIFLATNVDKILPTIMSRCHIEKVCTSANTTDITITSNTEMHRFIRAKAEGAKPEISRWAEEIDMLLVAAYNQRNDRLVRLFLNAMKTPPAPGGEELFWKNMWLQCQDDLN